MRRLKWRFQSMGILKLIVICITIFMLSTLYTGVYRTPDACDCEKDKVKIVESDPDDNPPGFIPARIPHREQILDKTQDDHSDWSPHKLAIIIPFRDRFEELIQFAPHMNSYLNAKKVRHKIYVINQVDSLRFNRATLINIGFLQSRDECDYIAMHDVDLLPLNPALDYGYPEDRPFHVAAPDLHPKYNYTTFVGGILLVNNKHFIKLNGLSNNYWGWGREDDEFYARMKEANLLPRRPKGISTGLDTFKHIHGRERSRDFKRYGEQSKASRKRDRITGLDTTLYDIDSINELIVNNVPVTIVNVQLKCDIKLTPWCITPEQHEELQKLAAGKPDYNHPYNLMVRPEKYEPPNLNNFLVNGQPLDIDVDEIIARISEAQAREVEQIRRKKALKNAQINSEKNIR